MIFNFDIQCEFSFILRLSMLSYKPELTPMCKSKVLNRFNFFCNSFATVFGYFVAYDNFLVQPVKVKFSYKRSKHKMNFSNCRIIAGVKIKFEQAFEKWINENHDSFKFGIMHAKMHRNCQNANINRDVNK